MPAVLKAFLAALSHCFQSRRDLILENLALRQQLAVFAAKHSQPLPFRNQRSDSTCGYQIATKRSKESVMNLNKAKAEFLSGYFSTNRRTKKTETAYDSDLRQFLQFAGRN